MNAYYDQETRLQSVLPCVHRSASELLENHLPQVPDGLTHRLSAVATLEVLGEKGADASTGQNWLPNVIWKITVANCIRIARRIIDDSNNPIKSERYFGG